MAKDENFKGIIDNFGASKKDIESGFCDGMAPGAEDDHDEGIEYPGENPESVDGGFLGRAKGWER